MPKLKPKVSKLAAITVSVRSVCPFIQSLVFFFFLCMMCGRPGYCESEVSTWSTFSWQNDDFILYFLYYSYFLWVLAVCSYIYLFVCPFICPSVLPSVCLFVVTNCWICVNDFFFFCCTRHIDTVFIHCLFVCITFLSNGLNLNVMHHSPMFL